MKRSTIFLMSSMSNPSPFFGKRMHPKPSFLMFISDSIMIRALLALYLALYLDHTISFGLMTRLSATFDDLENFSVE